MIDWNRVADFREGKFAGKSEEDMMGTGRTSTMLINVLDYVMRIKDQSKAPSAVVVIPALVMLPGFKAYTKSLAKEMGLFVTDETTSDLYINSCCRIHFSTENGPGMKGIGRVFVDHGVKTEAK